MGIRGSLYRTSFTYISVCVPIAALVVWLLQGLVQRNLPIIGDFLTQLLNLVEGKGSGS